MDALKIQISLACIDGPTDTDISAHIAEVSGNGIQGAFEATGRRGKEIKVATNTRWSFNHRNNKSEELPRVAVAARVSSCLSCKRPKKGEYSLQGAET
jgi:hypothetical protein